MKNPFKYFTKDWQANTIKNMCKSKNIDSFDLVKLIKWGNVLEKFVFATLKFLALMWIFNKYYIVAGFEKVIITLLVLIMVIIISENRDKYINM